MSKEKLKQNENPVGADASVRPNSRGITLIALIITIIVMLILVGVSVTVALNGGLFSTAKQASAQTQEERDKEQNLAVGKVEIGGVWYNSIEEYTNGKSSGGETEPTYKESITGLAEEVDLVSYDELETDIKAAVDAGKIQAVLEEAVTEGGETITYTAVVPTGFEISTEDGEDSISGGLVIRDRLNEFVWIPYISEEIYEEEDFGPIEEIDSQDILNTYYGTNEDGSLYYNVSDFTYETDKLNIETSINKYKGFYVGRYETTISENTIGSMPQTTVLTTSTKIQKTNNKECGWWGLYKLQKDMYSENKSLFSTMITNKQWNIIMNFTGYSNAIREIDTYTTVDEPDKSGSVYKNTTDKFDMSKNIYDLAGNVMEWTLTAESTSRIFRGGNFVEGIVASSSYSFGPDNNSNSERFTCFTLFKIV